MSADLSGVAATGEEIGDLLNAFSGKQIRLF